MTSERVSHWDHIYTTKTAREVSWFEETPGVSLRLLDDAGMTTSSCIIDIGGGASTLVDSLLARGLGCVAVLDVSAEALAQARTRLGADAERVQWIAADVTAEWEVTARDLWHDRAVFHFLTAAGDRAAYVRAMLRTLRPGGSAIIATFAADGPERCSGLPVLRYSPDQLASELGRAFELAASERHIHQTPWGAPQAFQYSRLRRQ